MRLNTRLRNIISGLVALVLVSALTTIGIQYAFGAFDDGYELVAEFDAAGQGLVRDSNVKMRGINVGHVDSIRLEDGRARVTLFINDGTDVPRSTTAVIRPKTLFGEKFVDLVPGELEGTDDTSQLHADGDEILVTTSPVELERVLAAAYPILQAINPDDVATVLGELATAADGMGPTINRQLVNGAALLDVQAANDANTRQFLEDLALLTDELAVRAPDLIGGARNLNVALPVLTRNGESFTALLEELERLSTDAADLLEGNTTFIDAAYTAGQASLDTLFANRSQLIPLVVGLRQYTQTVTGVSRIPMGDGTVMAAVQGLLDTPGQSLCLIVGCPANASAAATAPGEPAPGSPVPPLPPLPEVPLPVQVPVVIDGHVSQGTEAVVDILGGLYRGPR